MFSTNQITTKSPTLCPWHARQPRGAAGTPPPTLCCSRQQSEGESSAFPPDLCNSHSEPYTTTGEETETKRGEIKMNICFQIKELIYQRAMKK